MPPKGTGKGKRLMDRPEIREIYLSRIREGYGRYDAAALIDVDYSTIYRYMQAHPDFIIEVQDAESVSVESAHRLYREMMEDEDRDDKVRLAAAEKLERALGRYQKTDEKKLVEHQHTHRLEISGDMYEEVLAIRNRLALEQGHEVIEVEGEEL